MKTPISDATAAGWVRLLPDAEGLVVAFLSLVDVPATDFRRNRRAIGLMRSCGTRLPANAARPAPFSAPVSGS